MAQLQKSWWVDKKINPVTLLDLTLQGNSMNGYNATAIGEDRATLGSDPSALMVAYSPCFCRDKLRAVSSTVPPTYDIMLVPKKR